MELVRWLGEVELTFNPLRDIFEAVDPVAVP